MLLKRDFVFTPKGANRPLHIWLPEDYHTSREHYPVMYFFDGHNLFLDSDATYGKSWGMKEFMSRWEKPMIIVGIECGHEGQERMNEYMPYPPITYFTEYAPQGDATMEWIVNEVKPFIDREYRTMPFRECTAIGGSSMGGIMALFAAIRYNRWFSKAACVSTSMGFCMDHLMADLDSSVISPDTRFYLSWGTREAGCRDHDREDRSSRTYRNATAVAGILESRGAAVELHCQIGGGHCEADWEKLVPGFMDFLWLR